MYLRDARIVAIRADSPEATGMAEETSDAEELAGVPPEAPEEPLSPLEELIAPVPPATNGAEPVPVGA